MLLRAIVTTILLSVVVACAPVTAPQSIGEGTEAESFGDTETEATACTVAPTSRDQEGPYYSAGSPQRDSLLEEGMAGRPIRVSGRVLDTDCAPIAGAKVDFWQADAAGVYDNEGYRLRGHVVADDEGRYAIDTIEPGPYTGRPEHIHVKVFDADGRELLTTQLYFPGDEGALAGQVAPDLVVDVTEPAEGEIAPAPFDFVVQR